MPICPSACRPAPTRHIIASSALESFFGTFKNEMYHHHTFATRDSARLASIEYVEGYYNRRRPHSTIGYQIPANLMDGFFSRMDAQAEREAMLAA